MSSSLVSIFSTLLIPSSQLLSGIIELYSRAVPHETVPTNYTFGRVPVWGNKQALARHNEISRDTLALVSAWLLSGAERTPQEIDVLVLALRALSDSWRRDFDSIAKDAGLTATYRAEFFALLTMYRRVGLYKKPMTTLAVKNRLVQLGIDQARRVAAVHDAIGYSAGNRSGWLQANVNRKHPLSFEGGIGKWRTLPKNTSLVALGNMLGNPQGDWTRMPVQSSTGGVARMPELMKLLESVSLMKTASDDGSSGLLPANFSIERLPSGLVSLTVTLRPMDTLSWVRTADKEKITRFIESLTEKEKAAFKPNRESFIGSAFAIGNLYTQAKNWESEHSVTLESLESRYAAFLDSSVRDAVLKKLSSTFTKEEQQVLKSLFALKA